MPDHESEAPRQGRSWRLPLVLACLALLVGAGVAAAVWLLRPDPTPTPAGPLQARLTVTVWKAAAKKSFSVGAAGALPVRAEDRFDVDARYNQPAHTYLFWFDASGKVNPLYPWNIDALEVVDISSVPSSRSAGVVFSPMTIGKGWPIGPGSGLETVLLLARRTPLEPTVPLAKIVTSLPAPPLRDPGEFALFSLDAGSQDIARQDSADRGSAAAERDAPLEALLRQLAPHFESIRAVRFAHQGP